MSRSPARRLAGFAAGAASLATLAALPTLPTAVAHPARATAAAAGPVKIGLRKTSLGEVLVNGRGHTLYAFTRDSKGKDRCVTISDCAATWPPVITHGAPHAGSGAKGSLLSTIKLSGGRRQVTYAGHPLYTYVGDTGPGDTNYVGAAEFGGKWPAITAMGALIG